MIDAIDLTIIKFLSQNCRMSLQELSKKTGITRTAVKKRIDGLLETGSIYSFNVSLSMAMTNSEIAIAIIQFRSKPPEEVISSLMDSSDMIVQASMSLDNRLIVFSEYTSSEELSTMTNSFWNLEGVANVDVYSNFIVDRGGSIELTSIHKRILGVLLEDPRMSISEIATATGLTPRRISKTIDALQESRAVHFSIRTKGNVSGETIAFSKIRYDATKIKPQDLQDWIADVHQDNYLSAYLAASEPLLFVYFLGSHFTMMDSITESLYNSGFVLSVDSFLLYPGQKGNRPRSNLLKQMVTGNEQNL